MTDNREDFPSFEARIQLAEPEIAELSARVLEAAPLGVLAYNQDGDCVLANDRAARIVGATRAQVLTQNFNRIPSWEVSGLLTEARLCLERGEKRRSQVHLTTTFGREIWVDCHLVSMSVGEARHVLLMFEDATERALAEAEARQHGKTIEAMNRLFRGELTCTQPLQVAQSFIDIAVDLTSSAYGLTCELDAEQTVVAALVSQSTRESCGMQRSDADGLLQGMAIRGMLGQVVRERRSLIINRPDIHSRRTVFPDGHPPIENLLAVPLMRGETLFGLAAVANRPGGFKTQDAISLEALAGAYVQVRDRRESDVRLAETVAELSRSNEDLDMFASVASHDLREPLRKMLVFAERLNDELGADAPGRVPDFLERLTHGAQRMRTLVDGLLDYSRAGTGPSRRQKTDMDALLRGVAVDFEVVLQESGGQIEVAPLPPVSGDPVQLRQLFQNLIENSLKFRRDGVPPRISVTAAAEGESFRIDIADNGIGFDEAVAEKLFLPFYCADGGTSTASRGIGLAVVRRLAGRNGATVSARCIPGGGAVFSVVFPQSRE